MQAHKSVKQARPRNKHLICFLLISSLWLLQVDGQFFTKTTNSIPRMGRRSMSSEQLANYQSVRRSLIDRLVDEFGPNLLAAYKARRLSREGGGGLGGGGGGGAAEVAMQNEQPIDWLQPPAEVQYNSISPSDDTNGRYM